uniref:Tectonic family member 1 n=1 Tax=Sinocyclocheilus rhinocerous TaxID=307959 RepID=A0A673NCK9_9TELE
MSSVFSLLTMKKACHLVPTEENFDSLFGRFLVFFFGRLSVTSALQSPDVGNSSGYQGKIQEDKVIGVEVAAITLHSLEGTQTPGDPADLVSYIPVLLYNNVVQQVKYTFRYSEAGEILNVIASVLLGAIKSVTVPIQQELQITFLQEISSTPVLLFRGNPGYVVGRPLVAGTRKADGIVQSADPKGSLTFLQNSGDQDCLLGSSRRSPVLFGIDMVSGCTLKLSNRINCSLVSEVILWALKGQSFPDHVASFGNSLPQNPLDWVPIQNQTIASGTQACSIPLSYHLEVKWTKYRTLLNPQAQIMSVMETIITNTSSLVS